MTSVFTTLYAAGRMALCVAIVVVAGARTLAASDTEIIAGMNERVRDLNRQILETEDQKQREHLGRQLVATIEDALKQVSPQVRPMLEVGMKLVQPLHADVAAYGQATGEYFEGHDGDFRTIKSRDEIPKRAAQIDELERSNQKLLARLNAIEGDAEKMLEKAGVSAQARAGFMRGLRESAIKKMGALRAMRGLDSKLYVQWKAALKLLDAEWGKWRAENDQPIAFDNPEAGKKFSAIMEEVQNLADRQRAAEEAALSPR
jgi:hypothetical protein